MNIRSGVHLQVGDHGDFSVTVRYTDHEVVEVFNDERRGQCVRLKTPTGSERVFPMVSLGDVDFQR